MRQILVVCNGNIHRSVVAEYCINQMSRARGLEKEIVVISRGLQGTCETLPPKHRQMCEYEIEWSLTRPILEELGIDIYGHVSTPVTLADIEQAAVVIAMDRHVLSELPNSLMRQFPSHQNKMHLFLELEGRQEDVPDCGGSQDIELHQQVNRLIHSVVNSRVNILLDWVTSKKEAIMKEGKKERRSEMEKLSGSTVLILGAGQVGVETAVQCLKEGVKNIILHCLTADEAALAAAEVGKQRNDSVTIRQSHGNVLLPSKLATLPGIAADSAEEAELLNYLYGQLTPELVKSSLLYQLVDQFHPIFIVDAINMATAVGYRQCLYETVRSALADGESVSSHVNAIARSLPVPQLVRFIQTLQQAMKDFKVERYVKVSTTGLGGMGFNIMYTHGDLGEPGLSTKLLGKISAAGILHQLLWTLRHTPGFKINMVVPAALIGWGAVAQRSIVPADRPLVDCDPIPIVNLSASEPLGVLTKVRMLYGKTIASTVVASGENGDYALHDMAAITAPGQMGCITKEEVATAVLKALQGNEEHCLLAAMDQAQLRDSANGYHHRRELIDTMQQMVDSRGIPSPSLLNLGPRVAKLLWELEIISRVCPMLRQAVELSSDELTARCQQLIKDSENHRQMVLSLNLPIITNDFIFLSSSEPVTLSDLEGRADKQCVDLRRSNISRWQEAFRRIINSIDSGEVPSFSNWQDVAPDYPIKPGELLGYWFTLSGGGKKVEA